MNQFPSSAQVARIRLRYPPGTRLVLNHMEDGWAVPPGTRGEVQHIDDAGQLGMKWDNGRSLSLIPGVDSFRKLTEQELLEEQSKGIPLRGYRWALRLLCYVWEYGDPLKQWQKDSSMDVYPCQNRPPGQQI